jgi:hypothetical protein
MKDTNTGGPAFPVTEDNYVHKDNTGMTLRDYFAAKAMQCYMNDVVWHTNTYAAASITAYAVADAMLKARDE